MKSRRTFFFFLPGAVVAGAGAAIAAPQDNLLRTSGQAKCQCGSHIYHFETADGFRTGFSAERPGIPVCSWCRKPRTDMAT